MLRYYCCGFSAQNLRGLRRWLFSHFLYLFFTEFLKLPWFIFYAGSWGFPKPSFNTRFIFSRVHKKFIGSYICLPVYWDIASFQRFRLKCNHFNSNENWCKLPHQLTELLQNRKTRVFCLGLLDPISTDA